VETAKDARERIMIQTELEEAGFELLALKKRLLLANNTNSGGSSPEDVRLEQLLQVTKMFSNSLKQLSFGLSSATSYLLHALVKHQE